MIGRRVILGALLLLGSATFIVSAQADIATAQAEEKAAGYLDAVEDMPLMEGLHETGEGGIVFDKPNGRIVRSIAEGRVSAVSVRHFYAETLPQLGWQRLKKLELIKDLLIFNREKERLEIEIVSEKNGVTQVRFSIEPN